MFEFLVRFVANQWFGGNLEVGVAVVRITCLAYGFLFLTMATMRYVEEQLSTAD